jgi:hypothetical protein
MPVARIVTAARQHLEGLATELRQAGYTVEFALPGQAEADAELVIHADVVAGEDAMAAAARAAASLGADVVIAPGAICGDREMEEHRRAEEAARQERLAAEARARTERERQERERLAAEARTRAGQERQAALAAERARRAQVPRPASPAGAEPALAAARIAEVPQRHATGVRRRVSRQRILRRATLAASVVALLAMIGFAAATRIRPEPPLPQDMVQSPVQQEVPFGPARIVPQTTPAPTAAPSRPSGKPSPVPARARRKVARHGYVAEDEVIVHHYGPPRRQTTAQSRKNDGIRHYSDQ